MHAAARRRRGAAEIEVAGAGRVWLDRPARAHEELRQSVRAVRDVAPDVVRVVALDVGGRHHVPREHALAETRCEALELRLDALGHVDGRAVRHVAVGPDRVLARGRARLIEEALLADEHEWALGRVALPHLALGVRDVVERAAHMHGPGAKAGLRAPRDRAVERVVDLEDTRAAAIPAHRAAVSAGEAFAGDELE